MPSFPIANSKCCCLECLELTQPWKILKAASKLFTYYFAILTMKYICNAEEFCLAAAANCFGYRLSYC